MPLARLTFLLPYLLALIFCASEISAKQDDSLHFCTLAKKIDWNPYREIRDGNELAYLLAFSTPIISTKSDEPGILESFELLPDEKTFRGRIRRAMKWNDGSQVTSEQVMSSLIKALKYRPIGQRSSVESNKTINSHDFEIKFKSESKNFLGALREALSSNSRHNRIWIAKSKEGPFLLKYPYRQNSTKELEFKVGEYWVRPTHKIRECENAAFSLYPHLLKNYPDDYVSELGMGVSAIFGQTNTQKLTLAQRKYVYRMIRQLMGGGRAQPGISLADSFYMPGEPGFADNRVSFYGDIQADQSKLFSKSTWVIAVENPVILNILKKNNQSYSMPIRWVEFPIPTSAGPANEEPDLQILASGIMGGRYVVFQDLLRWNKVADYIANAPKTRSKLEEIARLSASTIPPDNQLLSELESAAQEEVSLFPLARRTPVVANRRDLNFHLHFSSSGELTFAPKNPRSNVSPSQRESKAQ